MIPLLVVLVAILIAVIVATTIVDFITGPPLKREVIVHTRRPDDQTVRGVLLKRSRRWLVLGSPKYIDGTTEIVLEGDLRVPADNVAFIQAL